MLRINAFKEVPKGQRIRHIWTALQWRTTSNPEDETICLVNMLGLKLDTILKIPPPQFPCCSHRKNERFYPPPKTLSTELTVRVSKDPR
jgi:hypothetical protein